MKFRLRTVFFLLALVFGERFHVVAQTFRGSISGTVLDSSGGAPPWRRGRGYKQFDWPDAVQQLPMSAISRFRISRWAITAIRN